MGKQQSAVLFLPLHCASFLYSLIHELYRSICTVLHFPYALCCISPLHCAAFLSSLFYEFYRTMCTVLHLSILYFTNYIVPSALHCTEFLQSLFHELYRTLCITLYCIFSILYFMNYIELSALCCISLFFTSLIRQNLLHCAL